MDLSILNLLEQDEDETMHSNADVDSFAAALETAGALSQQINHTPSQLFQKWQSEHNVDMSQAASMQNADKNSAQNVGPTPKDDTHMQRMQRLVAQQAMAAGRPANAMNRPARPVPFALVLLVIEPQLDKDRVKQLHGMYGRLQRNKISKEEFVRYMRSLVGVHMLKMVVYKVQQAQLPAKPNSLPMDNNAQKQRLTEHQSDSHGVLKPPNVNVVKQERDQPFPMQGLGKQHQEQRTHETEVQEELVHPTWRDRGNGKCASSSNVEVDYKQCFDNLANKLDRFNNIIESKVVLTKERQRSIDLQLLCTNVNHLTWQEREMAEIEKKQIWEKYYGPKNACP